MLVVLVVVRVIVKVGRQDGASWGHKRLVLEWGGRWPRTNNLLLAAGETSDLLLVLQQVQVCSEEFHAGKDRIDWDRMGICNGSILYDYGPSEHSRTDRGTKFELENLI